MSEHTKEEVSRMAKRLLEHHDHQGHGTTLERSNCGACVLNGYGDQLNGKPYAPNYSGWARVYVQAGRNIPNRYVEAFAEELKSENKLYADALREDIAYYSLNSSRSDGESTK